MFDPDSGDKIVRLTPNDSAYPQLLREIGTAPKELFVRGTLPPPDAVAVAIVGTRRASPYGKQVTRELASGLARSRIVIVSGLALGIDGLAHEAALEARGLTIAVLGSGVDQASVYPPAHRRLAEQIVAAGGALVSEYPPGFAPTIYSFPQRNRIIAGLAVGTLVTEAPAESGALITARHAVEYSREVFSVPHPITSLTGQGTNTLLKMGATLVTQSSDILEMLRLPLPETTTHPATRLALAKLTETETQIVAQLSRTPEHIDVLAKQTGFDSATVLSVLTLLEMRGIVRNTGAHYYIISYDLS
jgi:DNA processing protein